MPRVAEPPAPKIWPGPILDLANGELRELEVFLKALLLDTGEPPPVRNLLRGRSWSGNGSLPGAGPELIREMEDRFLGCELLALTEICRVPYFSHWIYESLVTFQISETILGRDDDLPPPWGIVACQAAVAACRIGRLVTARGEGSLFDPENRICTDLLRWLRSPWLAGETVAGDTLIFHLLGQGLERWVAALRTHIERNQRAGEKARSTAESAERRRREALPWTRGRQRARLDLQEARRCQLAADAEVIRARAALQALEEISRSWHASSPVPSGGPFYSPISADEPPPLPLVAPAAIPRAKGIQHWLIRRLADASRLRPEAADAGLGQVGRRLRPLGDAMAHDGGDKGWRIAWFLVVFYRIWADDCPPPEEVERRFTGITETQRAGAREIFAAWDQAFARHSAKAPPEFAQSDREKAFRHEFVAYGADWMAKIKRVSDFLRNVRGRIQE